MAFLQISQLRCMAHLEAHATQLSQQCHVEMRCMQVNLQLQQASAPL